MRGQLWQVQGGGWGRGRGSASRKGLGSVVKSLWSRVLCPGFVPSVAASYWGLFLFAFNYQEGQFVVNLNMIRYAKIQVIPLTKNIYIF